METTGDSLDLTGEIYVSDGGGFFHTEGEDPPVHLCGPPGVTSHVVLLRSLS